MMNDIPQKYLEHLVQFSPVRFLEVLDGLVKDPLQKKIYYFLFYLECSHKLGPKHQKNNILPFEILPKNISHCNIDNIDNLLRPLHHRVQVHAADSRWP